MIDAVINWHDGLMLKAEHFQYQDQYIRQFICKHIKYISPYRYGIIDLDIDQDLLESGKISINSISCIMPDCTLVKITENKNEINDIEINVDDISEEIYIGILIQKKLKYKKKKIKIIKKLTKGKKNINQILTITVKTPKIFLLKKQDNLKDYYLIKICEIKNISDDFKISLNEKFIPACLNIQTSFYTLSLLNQIKNLIEHKLKKYPNIDPNLRTYEIFQLKIELAKISFQFDNLADKTIHPHDLYTKLLDSIINIASITNAHCNIIKYNHNNLLETFDGIYKEFKNILSNINLIENNIEIPFEIKTNNIWIFNLEYNPTLQKETIVLEINLNQIEKLNFDIKKNLKIAKKEKIYEIVHRSLAGIKLEQLITLPKGMEYKKNKYYFAVHAEFFNQEKEYPIKMAIYINKLLYDAKIEIKIWKIKI